MDEVSEFCAGEQSPEKGVVQMLVLSRMRDESIMIGDLIEVTVKNLWWDEAELSIVSPHEFQMYFGETTAPIEGTTVKLKFDEYVRIGEVVRIRLAEFRGDKVRLGITAPDEIPVHRKEVYEAILREARGESSRPKASSRYMEPETENNRGNLKERPEQFGVHANWKRPPRHPRRASW